VFVGGDALTGAKFAIDAIAQGKEGAVSIHRFVQPGQSLVLGRDRREFHALDKESLDLGGFDRQPRQSADHGDGAASRQTFKDLRATFTEEQVKKETERCLGCGAVITDEYLCVGCGVCTTRCKFDAIRLERKYDGAGVALEELKPVVVKNILKRKVRIAARNLKKLVIPKRQG
jgi:NAD-dependent dihydropyrimidine dehydrogenase PreA subunit